MHKIIKSIKKNPEKIICTKKTLSSMKQIEIENVWLFMKNLDLFKKKNCIIKTKKRTPKNK